MTQLKIEDIEKGIIPQELNIITAQIKDALKFSRRVRAYLAVLIVQARRKYFENEITGWIYWCKEQGVADADIHPLRQAGDLLLDILPHDPKLYERLFLLDTEKIRSIGRLKTQVTAKLTLIDVVQKFLAAYPPEKLTRDKVRRCVAFCLGEVDSPELPEDSEKPKDNKYQPDLFGTVEALTAYTDADFEALADREDFNTQSAKKLIEGGIGMLDASLKYFEGNVCDDDTLLATTEAALRIEADRLRKIIDQNTARLSSAG